VMFLLLFVTSTLATTSCTFQMTSGTCLDITQCATTGGTARASRIGAQGCEALASNVQCCIPPAAPVPAGASPCSFGGNAGVCVNQASCASPKRLFPSSQGATGCESFANDVACCTTAPVGSSVTIAPLSPPSGQSCALAHPSGCSGFIGVKMTVNIRFADSVIRVNSHARNTNVKVYITDSFRPSGTSIGATRSRHKVGYAIDMNVQQVGGAFCDGDCLCHSAGSIPNDGARRFIQSIIADSTLWWGGDPSKPIAWNVGSCNTDSVHIQSQAYPVSSTYDSEASCLNSAWDAGRFSSFDCSAGASLLEDGAVLAPDEAVPGSPESFASSSSVIAAGGGVSIALIGGVVVGVVVLIGIVGFIAFFVLRSKSRSVIEYDRANTGARVAEITMQQGNGKAQFI